MRIPVQLAPDAQAQAAALAFASLVAANLGLIVRQGSGEDALQRLRAVGGGHALVAVVALGLLATTTLVPAAATWFKFVPPPPLAWIGAVLVPLLLTPFLPGRSRRR